MSGAASPRPGYHAGASNPNPNPNLNPNPNSDPDPDPDSNLNPNPNPNLDPNQARASLEMTTAKLAERQMLDSNKLANQYENEVG